jgi:hypothetical protein
MGKRKASQQAEPREALDPEQLRPSLAEARNLRRQLVERGVAFQASKDRVDADLAARRKAFGDRALAAELSGAPLSEADHEAHERDLAPMIRESERLARQLQAVAAAMPAQDTLISNEEKAAAMLVREQFPVLQRPLTAKIWAAVQGLLAVAQEDAQLRAAATAALADVHGGAPSAKSLRWLLPPGLAEALGDEAALKSWARDLRAAGLLDVPEQPAGKWARGPNGRPRWVEG